MPDIMRLLAANLALPFGSLGDHFFDAFFFTALFSQTALLLFASVVFLGHYVSPAIPGINAHFDKNGRKVNIARLYRCESKAQCFPNISAFRSFEAGELQPKLLECRELASLYNKCI